MSVVQSAKKEMVILKLAVPSPLRRSFDYLPPPSLNDAEARGLKPGIRMLVPFGSRKLIAVLLEISNSTELNVNKLKQAIEILDQQPIFPQHLLNLYIWASQYYQHPVGEVLNHLMPILLRKGKPACGPTEIIWKLREHISTSSPDTLSRSPRRRQLFQLIAQRTQISAAEIRHLKFSRPVLNALKDLQLIESFTRSITPSGNYRVNTNTPSLALNNEQSLALKKVKSCLPHFNCILLEGVTGSGKTEIYLQAIAQVLLNSKQALVLVPEISLTPQTIERFSSRFDCEIAVLHSGLNATERLNAWVKARDGIAKIVIGTRSALFTPMANPGLIVLDEEHDSSFKQQDGFRYSARDIGIMRARKEDITIILGSATPSMETLHNALSGRYLHLRLTERAGNALKPTYRLLDINNQILRDGFSEQLLALISEHLQRRNQVLVFINRRGYAPTLQCQNCGWIAQCRRCDVHMTIHRLPPHLRCHHCDSRTELLRQCTQCKSKYLTALGLGTQRSESLLKKLFPDTKVLRVDRDSIRKKNDLGNLLDQINSGEPCILIGTQMLAKGHHFPKVTLVAIIDADSGLFSADFRGQEHMAQLLTQVAGRAGRAELPGEVVIQTYHSSHSTFQNLIHCGYHSFAQTILTERKEAGMPPFSHLALIRAEAHSALVAKEFLAQVRKLAQTQLDQHPTVALEMTGPLPAPMEKRAGKFRSQLFLLSPRRSNIQNLLTPLCLQIEQMKGARKVRWSVDVDPVDMI